MSQYFPKPYDRSSRNVEEELDLSNDTTNLTYKSNRYREITICKKTDLSSLKIRY